MICQLLINLSTLNKEPLEIYRRFSFNTVILKKISEKKLIISVTVLYVPENVISTPSNVESIIIIFNLDLKGDLGCSVAQLLSGE